MSWRVRKKGEAGDLLVTERWYFSIYVRVLLSSGQRMGEGGVTVVPTPHQLGFPVQMGRQGGEWRKRSGCY